MKKLKMIFCGCLLVLAISLTACGNKHASVADYVASSQVQKAIELMNNMEGLDISVKAEGNKMVYVYQYTSIVKQAGMEEQLKAALEEQKATFEQAANDLKKQVSIDNPIVTVTYIDKNGDVIYSQDFSAN